MTTKRKQLIQKLLKGIETGNADSVNVINPKKYIQHNPQTHEGREGLAALFKRLAESNPRVNIVRIFSDGDYVFGHTEYDFSTRRIGFEVFRFEGDYTVEHWDNIQPRKGPNKSGHSMVDGTTEVADLEKTETNREFVKSFIEEVMIIQQFERLNAYIDEAHYTEHNPHLADGIAALRSAITDKATDGDLKVRYKVNHRILAEGNFVLSVSEGYFDSVHTAFYDLFRISNGKIVEHWDTTEAVPPQSEWKNDNGKF